MSKTQEEQNLLDKLANGELDGMVGKEREYHNYNSVYCGRYIKNGIPISYRRSEQKRFFDGQENEHILGKREEECYDTDERKLEFLQRYGGLIKDEAVRTYSAKYKPTK